tara:strand:- start:1667 stop:1777 length:111 start_codon:yes stop_codon:yes gene_type:complete
MVIAENKLQKKITLVLKKTLPTEKLIPEQTPLNIGL